MEQIIAIVITRSVSCCCLVWCWLCVQHAGQYVVLSRVLKALTSIYNTQNFPEKIVTTLELRTFFCKNLQLRCLQNLQYVSGPFFQQSRHQNKAENNAITFRSSRPEVFHRKAVLRNFAKFLQNTSGGCFCTFLSGQLIVYQIVQSSPNFRLFLLAISKFRSRMPLNKVVHSMRDECLRYSIERWQSADHPYSG